MPRRHLSSVDSILNAPAVRALVQQWGLLTVKHAVRTLQEEMRCADAPPPDWATRPDGYCGHVESWLEREVGHGYVPVFNLTGTIVHSNLGRSVLSEALAERALQAASRPVALEYDLNTGRRGDREAIVAHRLRLLCEAEHATVVNNNAAAVLIVLNTLALGREVPVSRGELIEIGGSFRLPEVMARAGSQLREVGTTNRTHPADYERAIGERTALLLKAHPSNYRVEGFTRSASVRELADIAASHGLPLCVDAGSGALLDTRRFGLAHEPTPRELLAAGADLVTFSGDKLLGGSQAGFIVGRRGLVDAINANPLKRALRLDKVALALLDATLKAYEDEASVAEEIPLLATLQLTNSELKRRAVGIADALANLPEARVDVQPAQAQLGSGALPGQAIDSCAVTVAFPSGRQLREFEARLRRCRPAVLGRIASNRLWLDMHGAEPLEELLQTLATLP